MAVDPFEMSEMRKQPSVDARSALAVLSPEFGQPKFPLLANALVPGGNNIAPPELAASIASTFPSTTIESIGQADLTYTYMCDTRTVGVAVDPSGDAYAPVSERRTQREVTIGTRGVSEITSRDIDHAPGRKLRPGRIVLEPYEDPITRESLFTDVNGNQYILPSKMHTCMEDLEGNWVIGHTLERTYTKGPDGIHAADLDFSESFLGDDAPSGPRYLELYAAANPLFPGEASPQEVLKAIEHIRYMASADVMKASGNLGDIYVDDLPNGSVAVGFQYARNGRIWMYQYIVDSEGYTTHYSYGRGRIFASPEEQEHDEAVEWWVEATFEYGVDPQDGQKRMTSLHRETKEEAEYGVAADEVKDETYTHLHVDPQGVNFVVANVQRDESKAGVPEHRSFDFQRDVVEPLVLDTSKGSPINMVQTQTVREERVDGSAEKYAGEKLRRIYHYGFVSTEDLSIPLIVVAAADSTLHCEIDDSEPFILVPAQKK